MGVLGFGSCCVGGSTGRRLVLPGGLSAEVLDAPHGSRVARRTAFAIVAGNFEACFEACLEVRRGADVVAGGLRNQAAAQRQFLLAGTIGEKAVVADADEASGQDVLQEATQAIAASWNMPATPRRYDSMPALLAVHFHKRWRGTDDADDAEALDVRPRSRDDLVRMPAVPSLDPSELKAYARRDWGAPARLACEQRALLSIERKVQLAIELYEAARASRPDWPDEATRRADLASHRRVRALLDRARHVGRR